MLLTHLFLDLPSLFSHLHSASLPGWVLNIAQKGHHAGADTDQDVLQ